MHGIAVTRMDAYRHAIYKLRKRGVCPGGVMTTTRSGEGSCHVRAAVRALALVGWLAACCAGCGGDDDGGAAGSGPAPMPLLGDPCTGDCQAGTTCDPGGLFPRQCSSQCSGVGSCSLLRTDKMTDCFGTGAQQCGIRCEKDGDCPTGTRCGMIGTKLGCLIM